MIGQNGCGKSTLLAAVANREIPIPDHIDIFHLSREMPASDKTALQCVKEVDEERIMLEKLAEELATCPDDGTIKKTYFLKLSISYCFTLKNLKSS